VATVQLDSTFDHLCESPGSRPSPQAALARTDFLPLYESPVWRRSWILIMSVLGRGRKRFRPQTDRTERLVAAGYRGGVLGSLRGGAILVRKAVTASFL